MSEISLSLSVASQNASTSQTYPSFSPSSPQTPTTPSRNGTAFFGDPDDLDLDEDGDDPSLRLSSHASRPTHRTTFPAHVPNAELAVFYLRAKETFLTPNAAYELDVGSEVLSVFHVGVNANSEGVLRDSGFDEGEGSEEGERDRRSGSGKGSEVVFRNPWGTSSASVGETEKEGEDSESGSGRSRRRGSAARGVIASRVVLRSTGGQRATGAGTGGTAMYPPDPAVFAELKEIVEGRLRECLAR